MTELGEKSGHFRQNPDRPSIPGKVINQCLLWLGVALYVSPKVMGTFSSSLAENLSDFFPGVLSMSAAGFVL